MSIRFAETACTIDPGTEIVFKDFLVMRRGDEVVRLDAKVDFADLPPEMHATAANLLLSRRMSLHLPTKEALERQDEVTRRYRERKAEYEALPWYRRMFARRPWDYPYEP